MIAVSRSSVTFPKSARLLRPADFRFKSYRRYDTRYFKLLTCAEGTGRIGISISKKVLRRAVARNRVRRLIKEAFRHQRVALANFDVHLIGLPALSDAWRELTRADLDAVFQGPFRGASPRG